MISFIIPTLLKPITLFNLVNKLTLSPLVAEMIIINNSLEDLNFNSDKVIIHTPKINMFVNPSWNKGVSIARGEYICLCNDDIDFDIDILDVIYNKLSKFNVGIIGPSESCFNHQSKVAAIKFKASYNINYGFGTLMFLKKESYVQIPESLKIWCGDDFLFHSQLRKNYRISGMNITTDMSLTSGNKEFDFIKRSDLENYPFAEYTPYLTKFRFNYLLSKLAINIKYYIEKHF
jgi:hypothetical protein